MGEMDAAEFDDVVDDWFIESLKTYKDLHVYQLEHPTRVIEWTSGRTVCVAGYRSAKNELLELLLPLRLLAEENKGLCAERDFKVVHGGFADGPVHCLRHIPGTRCAVTNDGRGSGLEVWDLGGDDSDVIRRTGSVAGRSVSGRGSRIAAGLSSHPRVLHGAESSHVLLTDLTSGQSLYTLKSEAADPLTSLQFVSDSVFLACCSSGDIYTADTRAPDAPRPAPPPSAAEGGGGVLWCADASRSCAGGGAGRVVRLSSSGEAVLSDLRDLGAAVSRAHLDVLIHHHNWDDVTVSWAPALDDCIAASGFGGTVQIYDTSAWAAEPAAAQPLFEHRGHVVSSQRADSLPVLVTAHAWHPERPRTLLSAAADGSVHVWDWVERAAAAC